MIRRILKTIGIIFIILLAFLLFLNFFFFRNHLNKDPVLCNFKESDFDLKSKSPFFYQVNDCLFYSSDGNLSYKNKIIWKGTIDLAFVSPNNKYIAILEDKKIIILNSYGNKLKEISKCSEQYYVDNETGTFISSSLQWSENSDYFIILQDKLWVKYRSKENLSSIYKFEIKSKNFYCLADLNELSAGSIATGQNQKIIYYEYPTAEGELALKKFNIESKEIVDSFFTNSDNLIPNLPLDSIFINYDISQFFSKNYSRTTEFKSYWGKDTSYFQIVLNGSSAIILKSTAGYSGFKGGSWDCFGQGYFMPGEKFYILNINSSDFEGQIVIDVKTLMMKKLPKNTKLYFSSTSKDYPDFKFIYNFEPNI